MADEQHRRGSLAVELRRGSLAVELRRVTWTLAVAPPSSEDAVRDNEQQCHSLWAAVQLAHTNGQLLERFWFPVDDDNTVTQSIAVDDTDASDSNGLYASDFAYQQSSRALLLTHGTLETLANAQLQIAVYCGATRSRATDELVGELQLPLIDVVLHSRLEQRVAIATARFARLEIDVHVQADADFADIAVGCRLLRFDAFAVQQLPREWTLSADSDDDALQLCAAADRNLAVYELELQLPVLADTSGRDDTGPPATESAVVSGGRLQYDYEASRDASAATADSGDDDAANAQTPQLSGTWHVTFPASAGFAKLFLKDAVERLREFLFVEKHIRATLRRTVVDSSSSAIKAQDVATAVVQLHLAALAAPGTTHISASARIRSVSAVTREALEAELATATTTDDKKRLLAALADHDATLQQATAVSHALAQAGTFMEMHVAVGGAPLVQLPPPALETSLPAVSIGTLIPPRDVANERAQQRDALADLRDEIRRVVLTLLHEYDDAFQGAGSCTTTNNNNKELLTAAAAVANSSESRDAKRQALVFRLNTQGAYQRFKDALKKRIVPIIRDRFARAEFAMVDDDGDSVNQQQSTGASPRQQHSTLDARKREYFAQLYTLVMQQVHVVLHEAVDGDTDALERMHAESLGQPSAAVVAATLDALQLRAMENLANGDVDKSEALHLDRIAFAEQHCAAVANSNNTRVLYPSPHALETVWLDYARFSLAQGDTDRAGASLRASFALNAHALPALLTHTALLCELRDALHAEAFAKAAVDAARSSKATAWHDVVLAHALLGLYFAQSGRDAAGNLTRIELLHAQHVLVRDGSARTACLGSVWLMLAEFAHELRLHSVTHQALALCDASREPRDVLSARERVMQRALAADLALLTVGTDSTGSSSSVDTAVQLLRDAVEIDAAQPFAWLVLARAHALQDVVAAAPPTATITCFERALESRAALRTDAQRLALFLHLGLALLQTSQFSAAERVFMTATAAFRSVASCWLGVGIAALRREQYEPARLALAEANRLDATNADVWGYLALLALSTSASTTSVTLQAAHDAQQCVAHALRHGLSNAGLLRELSNGFVAIDRLEDAERLLRRALVCHDSSLTRKTLADVLAAQHCAEAALRQYEHALATTTSVRERCALLETSAKLLTTLGRPDDASAYRAMATQFEREDPVGE